MLQAQAWTSKTPLPCAGATSRHHHLNPAEAHGRWRGRGAKPSGLLSVTTTHALLALKVQRKVSNGVASLAAAGSSLDRPKIAAVPAPQRSTDPHASIPADILALGPSCVSCSEFFLGALLGPKGGNGGTSRGKQSDRRSIERSRRHRAQIGGYHSRSAWASRQLRSTPH